MVMIVLTTVVMLQFTVKFFHSDEIFSPQDDVSFYSDDISIHDKDYYFRNVEVSACGVMFLSP